MDNTYICLNIYPFVLFGLAYVPPSYENVLLKRSHYKRSAKEAAP